MPRRAKKFPEPLTFPVCRVPKEISWDPVAKRSDAFSTAVDNQSSIQVELFLGERPLARDKVPIGSFQLNGIPPAKRGTPQVTAEFSVEEGT